MLDSCFIRETSAAKNAFKFPVQVSTSGWLAVGSGKKFRKRLNSTTREWDTLIGHGQDQRGSNELDAVGGDA
jgi:hypothetical protein